ncbi:hypothetical protein KP509_22G052400 [Ceratopteris richardii]|uniref:Uncharacterized protein n=1 Tax=Ceratopteris richardii TaxID=49495 RepID=A0A8T2S662_CERRI|nr:hypothetical protein KP509_22G052400 [Ceratopteris richardii]
MMNSVFGRAARSAPASAIIHAGARTSSHDGLLRATAGVKCQDTAYEGSWKGRAVIPQMLYRSAFQA